VSEKTRLLVIDDEESICVAFRRYFESRGFDVTLASSGAEGLECYRAEQPDIVFLDVRLGDMSGLDVLSTLRQEDPSATVIIITAYGSLETVTRAMRDKAFDFLVKPLDLDQAAELVSQARACRAAIHAMSEASASDDDAPDRSPMVGASPAMQAVYKRIGKAALSDATVLILGETGTGKEVVARAIHDNSPRHDKPFVAVNCGALPESLVESELFGYVRGAFTGADTDKPGRFESANGGTLLLDEIGDLPMAAQVKLLRFLDSHAIERLGSIKATELDIRIVAATNRDLSEAISAGRFRADLYYRLAVIQIELPPLAERRGDIMPLARHFLRDLATGDAAPSPITDEASRLLERYGWPGNVRELRNAVEHARTLSGAGPIMPAHLPETVRKGRTPGSADSTLEEMAERYAATVQADDGAIYQAAIAPLERALIRRALDQADGNQSLAAERLGLHRNTLRNKIRQYGLDAGRAQ
jgi:DNA-binding NtrC family response regulator